MAFTFGLLHGPGFADALADVGLPQHEIPLALLMFNVAVELGQVLFVAAILAFVFVLQKNCAPTGLHGVGRCRLMALGRWRRSGLSGGSAGSDSRECRGGQVLNLEINFHE